MADRTETYDYVAYVRHKVEQGLRDAEEGRLLEHQEVKRRLARWPDDVPRSQSRSQSRKEAPC